jgi:hypothetical protein
MDPYIEACRLWGDFHHGLIFEIERILEDQVPEKYLVRLNARHYIALVGAEGKQKALSLPDLRGLEESNRTSKSRKTRTSAASERLMDAGARTMQAFVIEEHREPFIEIYEDDPERLLVTRIEILSPMNKRKKSKGRKLYLRKRQNLLLGMANLVEIDLLRGGQRMPMLCAWPECPYTLLVCRKWRAPYCTVWPAHYVKPLPVLPIPLSRPDPDIHIDLQPLIASIYARSRYERSIDYSRPLDPPLPETDAAWLAESLKGGRRRPTRR